MSLHFEVTCVITSFQCNFKHLSSVVCCKIENQVTNSAIDDTVVSKDEMRYATMGSTMDLKPSLLSFKRHLVLFNLFPKYLHFHDFKINPFFLSVFYVTFSLKPSGYISPRLADVKTSPDVQKQVYQWLQKGGLMV